MDFSERGWLTTCDQGDLAIKAEQRAEIWYLCHDCWGLWSHDLNYKSMLLI
jgi:hypothetical protein